MNAHQRIQDFVLSRMPNETVTTRIELTDALAEIAASIEERKELALHADALRAVETTHQQLLLKQRLRNS